MIGVLFEQQIVQNVSLAAEALWYAANENHLVRARESGVPFPLILLVLPIVFHQRSAEALATKTQSGALFKALGEDREIIVGLQSRMESLSDRTFKALSLAFRSGLLRMDRDIQRQILPGRRTPPVVHVTNEVKTILSAAKRLGHAFGEMTPVQISNQLNVRF